MGDTIVLPFLSDQNQSVYLWFLIAFPSLLVTLFFLTLNFNNKVLYAPSDFEDEKYFVGLISKQFKDMEFRLENTVSKEVSEQVSSIEASFSSNEILSRAKSYFKDGRYDEALEEVNHALELKETGTAFNLKAMIHSRKMNYRKAIEICTKGLELDNTASETGALFWNRACYKSLAQHDPKSIVDDLNEAVLHNKELTEKLESDNDLEYVRKSAEYGEFIQNILGK